MTIFRLNLFHNHDLDTFECIQFEEEEKKKRQKFIDDFL